MSTCQQRYQRELESAPIRHVSPQDFVSAATAAGWQLRTITLFLKPPQYVGPVLVRKEALVIGE